MNKDRGVGAVIFSTCLIVAVAYIAALLWPTLEAIRLWLIAIPVAIAFVGVLAIGAWIGWTMASTPPPKPIEDSIRSHRRTEDNGKHADPIKPVFRALNRFAIQRSTSEEPRQPILSETRVPLTSTLER